MLYSHCTNSLRHYSRLTFFKSPNRSGISFSGCSWETIREMKQQWENSVTEKVSIPFKNTLDIFKPMFSYSVFSHDNVCVFWSLLFLSFLFLYILLKYIFAISPCLSVVFYEVCNKLESCKTSRIWCLFPSSRSLWAFQEVVALWWRVGCRSRNDGTITRNPHIVGCGCKTNRTVPISILDSWIVFRMFIFVHVYASFYFWA